MATGKLNLRPGVNTNATMTQNEGGWSLCNLIRWKNGFLEKIGGWLRLFDAPAAGLVRAIHAFQDLDTINNLVIAGDGGLQVWNEDAGLKTINVVSKVVNVAQASFTPTAGSKSVLVASPGHGLVPGTAIYLPIAMSIGGVTRLPAAYTVKTVPSLSSYTFETQTVALNGASGTLPTITTVALALAGENLVSAAIGPSGAVIATDQGTIGYRSSFDWTSAGQPFGSVGLPGAAYGKTLFVIAAQTGVVKVSTNNGVGWFNRTSGLTSANCAAFGNNIFLVGGNNGRLSISSDATATIWSPSNILSFTTNSVLSITYANSLYVAVGGSGSIATSPDAVTWTGRTSGISEDIISVTFGSGKYVGLTSSGNLVSSPDGVTWTLGATNSGSRRAIAFGNGVFVVVGDGGVISTSTDLVTWAQRANPFGVAVIYTVTYGNGLFMATGQFGRVIYSIDGAIWFWPVVVTLIGHNQSVGDQFQFQVATTASNITISGTNRVNYVIDANSFVIDGGGFALATATATENGGVQTVYYGVTFDGSPNNWFLDNLGNNSTISYTNSPLFIWTPPLTDGVNAAIEVTTAPTISAGSLVAMPQAQIVLFGASVLGVQDPLLLAWSDAGTYDVWAASSLNQAGTYRLSRGSRIVGGLQAPQSTLIWTDTDLWSMQYNGPPFVYGFTIIATGCGLISPKARAGIGGVTYWMGRDGFWQYNGGSVQPLPCDVWDVVFTNIDRSNVNKCFAGASSSYQDMYFFYPSLTGGGEVDSYVKVNFSTGTPLWDYGTLLRTAWIDNNVFGPPMGADGNFRIQQHETGYDNDDLQMTGSYAESGMIALTDGDDILSVQQIQPDFKFFGSNGHNTLTLWSQNYAGGSVAMSGPYPVTPTTQYVSPRVRARQMALRIDLTSVKGTSTRMGALRVKSQPAGKRP